MTDDNQAPGVSNLFLWGLTIWGTLIGVLYAYTQNLGFDEIQLLEKGVQLARHHILVPFGNVVTGGLGNTPGILTSLIVGLPMMLFLSPISPVAVIFLLSFIALYLYTTVVREIFGRQLLLVVMLFYWLSLWHTSKMLLWNPSYLFFFSTVHLWSAYRMRQQRSAWYTICHVFAIGGALQLHSSWVVLALLSLILFKRKMIKVSWPAFIFASAVMIAMLWPYLMSFFSPSKPVVSIKEDTFLGRGLIYGYPLIKGIFYWFRYASTYFSSDIFTGTTYTWLPSWLGFFMKITLAGLKWVLAIATLVVAFRANFELAKTFKESCRRQGEMSPRDWLRTYTCWTFVAVLVAVAASPVTISYWHLLIIFPQSILPLLFFWDGHQRLFQTVTQSKTILIGFIIVVSLISFFGAMSSVRHDYKVGVHTEFILLDLEGRFEPAATKPPQ